MAHNTTPKSPRGSRRMAASVVHAVLMAMALVAISCARMGQPDGGWYDETPPRVTFASPGDKSTGVNGNRVSIHFNEYIKLEDAASKVVISPPQIEMAEIKTGGKRIDIELKDSMKPNTTYTIDFSDAILDNNEGNPMGNYTYSFATGDRIDTLEVAGYVLNASDLEPIKGILVGLHDDLHDSAFSTKPLVRVARTDSRGRFIIKGVAPGRYFAYALQDADGNYLYNQKSEMLAFARDTIAPRCAPDIRQDTIWRDSLRIDSIIRTTYTHFYPDDVALLAFTAVQTDRYLVKTERTDHRKLGVYFSTGSDTLPRLRGLDFDEADAFVIECSEKLDTITYWLSDTALINRDTLTYELSYYATDTLGQLALVTDTIQAIPRMSAERRRKDLERELEEWQKEQEKARKRDQPYDTVMPPKLFAPKFGSSTSMAPDQNVYFEVPVPLARLDTAKIHLYSKIDTVWYRSRFELKPVEGRLRQYVLRAEWRPDVEYSLEMDTAAMTDIYGMDSKAHKSGIRIRSLDDFSTLAVSLPGVDGDSTLMVQLLNSSDKVVKQVYASGSMAEFFYVKPGAYYLRAFRDDNRNGLWDTGDYAEARQAERTYYYPKKVECKQKWDITVTWQIGDLPPYRQKPAEIVKQKADKERTIRSRNADRARSLGIEYVAP